MGTDQSGFSRLVPSAGVEPAADAVVLTNEFASVRVAVDRSANGVRLFVEDIEAGEHIYLDPLELASLCHATPEDRLGWLRVGPYRPETDGDAPDDAPGDAQGAAP